MIGFFAGTLCCEEAEEAKTLVPSLEGKKTDEDLQELLDEVRKPCVEMLPRAAATARVRFPERALVLTPELVDHQAAPVCLDVLVYYSLLTPAPTPGPNGFAVPTRLALPRAPHTITARAHNSWDKGCDGKLQHTLFFLSITLFLDIRPEGSGI